MKRWGIAALAVLLLAAGGFGVWWKATEDDRRAEAQREARYRICVQLAAGTDAMLACGRYLDEP